MTGQKDDPEDLIAELTRLMASDVKANPVQPAKPAAPTPAEAPVGERPAGVPPTIRIPGMSQPVASAPAAPPSGSGFDFGRPSQGTPVTAPEPLASWQDRLAAKPVTEPAPPRPESGASPDSRQHSNARQEPSLSSGWRPAIAPGEAERDAAPSGPAFEFDFGFNKQRPDAAPRPPAAAPAAQPVAPAEPAPGHDPIADLIAAELDAAMAAPAPVAVTPPAPAYTPEPAVDEDDDDPVDEVEYPAPVPVRTEPAPVTNPVALQRANISAPPAVQAPPAPRPASVRPPAENDRFTTAPVFGLGNRPAGESRQPPVELDPMDEIENLIGEAVRVELNAPPPPMARSHDLVPAPRPAPPQPQPIVPPLGSHFAPRRASLRDTEPAVDDAQDAEEAILAAVATSGDDFGRVDDFEDERPQPQKRAGRRDRQPRERLVRERPVRERQPRVRRASGGFVRQLVVPAVAGTLLLALGLGIYWVLGMGSHDGDVPVLAADATPAKTIPEKPEATAPRSVVMDELTGSSAPPASETLVPRDQTATAGTTAPVAVASGAAADPNGGLANRKVRTVTVRPDGTIVSSDDSVAGAAQLPVDRPNVPAVPGAAVASADPAVSTDVLNGAATLDPPVAAIPAPAPAAPVAAPDPIAAIAAAATDSAAPTPLPPPPARPTAASSQVASAVNALRDDSADQPMDLAGAPAAPAASGEAQVETGPLNAVAHVQLSSQQSVAGAQASATTLQRRFGSLLNGARLSIVKADLGSKGVFYRVVMPTSSLSDAQQLCSSIRANGGDCVAHNG